MGHKQPPSCPPHSTHCILHALFSKYRETRDCIPAELWEVCWGRDQYKLFVFTRHFLLIAIFEMLHETCNFDLSHYFFPKKMINCVKTCFPGEKMLFQNGWCFWGVHFIPDPSFQSQKSRSNCPSVLSLITADTLQHSGLRTQDSEFKLWPSKAVSVSLCM